MKARNEIMKKLLMVVTAMAVLMVGALSVAASEVDEVTDNEFVSNMDVDTYIATRTAQVEAALEAGLITEDQAQALLLHIEEVSLSESFGFGPTNGVKGDGNATCVLGEDSNLGIFRSESAGMRTGNGNGVALKLMDGNGNSTEKGQRNQGNNSEAKGNRQGTAAGQGLNGQGNDGECVLEN